MTENKNYLGNYGLLEALQSLYKPKPPERLKWVKPIEDHVLRNFRRNIYDLNSETTPDFYTKIAEKNHKQFGIPESYTFNILFRFFGLGGMYHLKNKMIDAKSQNQKIEISDSFIYDDFIDWINNEATKIQKAYEKASEKYTKHYIV